MSEILASAAKGYSCLVSWSDLLDRINVFPVADGDTGTNLRLSLAPLNSSTLSHADVPDLLASSAVGNSGNIAVPFFREFLRVKNPRHLADRAAVGLKKARGAVLDPKDGTMLDVFAALVDSLAGEPGPLAAVGFLPLCGQLQNAVLATSELLPEMRAAGVVDAGALGMFIFLEGFFKSLTRFPETTSAIPRLFAGKLAVDGSWVPAEATEHCLDILLAPHAESLPAETELAELGQSIVINRQQEGIKIHLHTEYPEQVREELATMGSVLSWKDEDMAGQSLAGGAVNQSIHLMTDAAGSLDRNTAKDYGITLLDSYIIAGNRSLPESLCDRENIYAQLRSGNRVTTAQASLFERHRQYESAVQQHERVLYISTGSVYTGNHATASAWQTEHDRKNRFSLLDSGAASGRLALMVLLTARYAQKVQDAEAVIRFAAIQDTACSEYVFIDSLQYLAASGRVSKAKGFFGDLLHMKPVISPMPDGVAKKGVVRSRSEQLSFACKRLTREAGSSSMVLLQFSDNQEWVEQVALPKLQKRHPGVEIVLMPLSLTSGVHMGPGTWAMAFEGR